MKQTPKQIKAEEKQMMLAFMLIVIVLLTFQFFTPKSENNEQIVDSASDTISTPAPVVQQEPVKPVTTNNPVVQGKNIDIKNDFVVGHISADGGIFNSLELEKYKQTIQKDSPDVVLLSNSYLAQLMWKTNLEHVDLSKGWHTNATQLTPEKPAILTWENHNIKITRQISMDDHYMFTIQDTLVNKTQQPINVAQQGIVRIQKDNIAFERSSVHTGFVALVNNKLQEDNYDSVVEKSTVHNTLGGWFGITQKYWQTIFIPEQNENIKITDSFNDDWYISQFESEQQPIPAGSQITKTVHLFAGAKDLDLINDYEKQLNIPKFDLTIDFGWFYFLTKPFLYFLQWLYALVGNMGIAILIFATLLRIALLPMVTKSYISMAKLKKIQPEMKALQERYKDDRQRLQREMMALYAREHVNPAGGCLPMLIQVIPFYALYKVLSVSLQMRGAPFFGWLNDLSMPDSSSVLTLCGLVPWPVPSFLNIGILPVIMGLTMYIQQKLQPAPSGADKAQMGMFKWMPVIFTFMMGNFASGLVLYWTWSNILSIAQQRYIIKKVG